MHLRTVEAIRDDITHQFGFFPPFFMPALETPAILENLWQQTRAAYVENPIPAQFKEKLAAILARHCSSPYLLICHSSSLQTFGIDATAVLHLLQQPILSPEKLVEMATVLHIETLSDWPAPNSPQEDYILHCCSAIFLNQDLETCRQQLRTALPSSHYQYLFILLAYYRTCFSWTEAHPEISYEADLRFQNYFEKLISDEPSLSDFFFNYRTHIQKQSAQYTDWLAQENKQLRLQQRINHERLEITLNGIGDAVISTTADAMPTIDYLNPVAEQLTGWKLHEARGRPVLEVFNIIHQHTRKPAENPIARVLSENRILGLANHTVLISRCGKEYVIEDSAAPIRDSEGVIVGVVVVFHDVTEKKKIEQQNADANKQIEIERQKLIHFFNQAPIPLAILEGPEHQFVFTNPPYVELLFGGKQVVGSTVAEALPETIPQGFIALLDEVYRTGLPYHGKEIPVVLTQKDGSQKAFVFNFVYQPTHNTNGDIEGILVIVIDITEQVHARESIENQQKWLESILNRLPTNLILLEPETKKVKFSNDAMKHLMGVSLANTIPLKEYGQRIKAFDTTGRLLDISELPSAKASREEEMKDEEIVIETPTGRFHLSVSSAIIPASDGHERSVLLALQDISAVRDAQEQFKLFTELAPHMPFIADANGGIVYYSRQWYDYIGHIVGTEGWGWKDQVIHHPDDLEHAIEAWSYAVRTGTSYENEYRLRRADGQYRWHLGRATPIRDPQGQITKWFGANIDIHEQKILAERLSAAVRAADLGFWDCQLEDSVIEWNDQLRAHYGFPKSKLQGNFEEILQRVIPEDQLLLRQALADAQTQHNRYHVEFRVHSAPGETRWLKCEGEVLFDSLGNPKNITGTSLDITYYKQIQQELIDSESRFRFLADTMPQIVWTARADGILNYTNQRWTEYSGSSDPEAWTSFIHPEDSQRVLEQWDYSVETGLPYETEFRLQTINDGTYRWHLVRALAVSQPFASATRWYGTCTDVTEQKKLQTEIQAAMTQAETANATKSAFLANMSHEIRTPLGAILGFTELLKTAHLSEEAREFLAVIDRNGQTLMRIIDDILDLSKVEAGQMSLEIAPFSLSELIQDVIALFGDKVKAKGLSLEVNNECTIDYISSDPARIQQILINLIGNAVKFTSHGGIRVTLSEHLIDKSTLLLCIRIKDTGIGLNNEQAAKLFKPFVQADNSTSRRFGGTGLGLALSKRLAQALNGDVQIEEHEPQKGCTFKLELEVRTSKQLLVEPLQPVLSSSNKRLEQKRILLVDDAPDNRMLMKILLCQEGAEVDEASNGEEAIHKALSKNFDLVLMDIQMPEMDGYEALSALKKQGYMRPVIALTAHAMIEEKRRTLAAGFIEHVMKPVNPEVLVRTILKYTHL